MNTICHADLLQLIETPSDRFVSIYIPTYPAGRETPQNMIRFKEMVNRASDLLCAKGMSTSEIRSFMAPATQLLERHVFWNALAQGLAVLISADDMRVWHLPFRCEELCMVGKRFHITPLLAWFNMNASYYALAVSQNDVRLLHSGRDRLQEVDVPSLPTCRTEALHYDPRKGFFQTHSGQPQMRGKESLVFTGQGGEVDVAKDEIASFFRIVDASVSDFLKDRTEPLVFAGVDYLFPIYREHNHYPHLLPAHVSGNPDLLSPLELRERVWPLVGALLRQRQESEVAKYWNLVGQGRCSNHIEDIVAAAHAGAVETLFISPTVRRLGKFDARTNLARLDDPPRKDSEDLVNLAACFVLKTHGNVEAVTSDHTPGGGAMAAIFRYAAVPAIS